MKKLTTNQFREIATIKHNGKYNYDKVSYIGSKIPVEIYCNIHGNFFQTPNIHLNGSGCPYCVGKKVSNINSLSQTHSKLLLEWNYSKNTITPDEVTAGSHKQIQWIDSLGHEWLDSVLHRTHGRSCPYCSGKRICNQNKLSVKFPLLADQWHLTKNENLTPNDVTFGSNKKVWWSCQLCKCDWQSTINSRTSMGAGCPNCKSVSLGEKTIKSILLEMDLCFVQETIIPNCKNKNHLRFDFKIDYIQSIVLLEYQSKQHYMKTGFGGKNADKCYHDLIKNDLIKKNFCDNNQIPLLQIPYWHFLNLYSIIDNVRTAIYNQQDIYGKIFMVRYQKSNIGYLKIHKAFNVTYLAFLQLKAFFTPVNLRRFNWPLFYFRLTI